MIACNDYILLECCIYRVLKKHFRSHAAYGQLMDLFHEVRGAEAEARGNSEELLRADREAKHQLPVPRGGGPGCATPWT